MDLLKYFKPKRKPVIRSMKGNDRENGHPLLSHIPDMDLHAAEVKDIELNNRLVIAQDRLGKFTASEFDRLMTYENRIDDFPAGAMSYVREKVAEVMTDSCDYDESFTSDAMQWGKDHELEAVERFHKETDLQVVYYGDQQKFINYQGKKDDILNGNCGGTPDGHIDKDNGIEVKCPLSKTHLSYILDIRDAVTFKETQKKYYWQVQGYMMLTGRKAWYFVTYDNRFKDVSKQIHIIKIVRDETDIQKLRTRLEMAVRAKNEILKVMKFKKIA